MGYAPEITRQCRVLLALLSDGLPHPSSSLYESAGWIPRATMRRRLDDLRKQGHDVRIVENRRDWNRKARVVEYQLFPAGKPGETVIHALYSEARAVITKSQQGRA